MKIEDIYVYFGGEKALQDPVKSFVDSQVAYNLLEERDYWKKQFEDLEVKRASCCVEMEKRVNALEDAIMSTI